jgi:hypothetical protein
VSVSPYTPSDQTKERNCSIINFISSQIIIIKISTIIINCRHRAVTLIKKNTAAQLFNKNIHSMNSQEALKDEEEAMDGIQWDDGSVSFFMICCSVLLCVCAAGYQGDGQLKESERGRE